MDIHNIDEYLDLQGQNQLNLLSTEEINTQPQEELESEWHSATAAAAPHSSVTTLDDNSNTPSLSEMLEASSGNPYLFNMDHASTTSQNTSNTAEWGLLHDSIALQGIHLTQIMSNSGSVADIPSDNHFITPDSLLKQQPVQEQPVEEKRVTRSRTSISSPTTKKEVEISTKKKTTNSRGKKLYCICQQPYNGKPMVQCDRCEKWFHCTCVGFDPDDQDEDIDWVCKNCFEGKQETKQKPEQQEKSGIEAPKAIPAPAVISSTTTRQTRGSSRNQSKCLYPSCSNHTRADSYCSDVCARRHKEQTEQPQRSNRVSKMKSATLSISTTAFAKKSTKSRTAAAAKKSPSSKTSKKEDDDSDHVEEEDESEAEAEAEAEDEDDEQGEEEEEEKEEKEEKEEEEQVEGTETPDTPMSPSQMTEEENPVRRNVIKNITTILKQIMDTALESNPKLFDEDNKEKQQEITTQERAEKLAKSIENTMLDQLGDTGKSKRRTCGEPYKSKFRSLVSNLKDKQNQRFQLRVITGETTPLELVKMSSEDMANPELKSKAEDFRKMGLKSVVMKLDNTPFIKKTHKGDIIMVPNRDNDMNHHAYSEAMSRYDTPTLKEEESESKKADSTTAEKSESAAAETVEEGKEEKRTTATTSDADKKVDPLDDILARIGIPAAGVTHGDEKNSNNKRSSLSNTSSNAETKKRKVTFNVEELLGDEDDETPFQVDEVDTTEFEQEQQSEEAPPEEIHSLPTIWQGKVNMPQVAEFEASARQIGGRVLTDEEWSSVLSPTMWIEGRIPADRVTSYVTQTQYSTSREIVLLEIEPQGNSVNQTQSQTLLKYLDSRQRYAVVGHNKTKIKDFYLIPLYKVQHIPDCLYVVRVEETQRQCDLFLGVLVLTKQVPSVSGHPPKVPVAAQVVPATPATSHPSPASGTRATSSHQQQHHHHQQEYTPYAIPPQQQQQQPPPPPYYQQQQQQQPSQYGYSYQQAANAPSYDQQQQQQGYHRRSSQQQNSNNQRYYHSNNNSRNNNNHHNHSSYNHGSSYRPNY